MPDRAECWITARGIDVRGADRSDIHLFQKSSFLSEIATIHAQDVYEDWKQITAFLALARSIAYRFFIRQFDRQRIDAGV